jgi:hypothetical protein
MDDEEESFEYENPENLEDDDDDENEKGQERALESESEFESESELETEFSSNKLNVIETLEDELDNLNTRFQKGEITFQKYNENLIFNQTRIADERIKLMNFTENNNISGSLISELDILFVNLQKGKTISKLDPYYINKTIDDTFRKYGEALQNELSRESEEFFFESNPITSNISNIVNLPIPDKYQKQAESFEHKISRNDISIDDIYAYLELRFNILIYNLQNNLKNDILYLKFHMDLQMEFVSLRSELQLLIGETSVVIDEDIDNFNNKNGIKTGVLKSNRDFLSNINVLKTILEAKVANLIKKYESIQESLFKKKDSYEVLKVFKQLRGIYIKNEFSKLERRFTDTEIIDNFKNESLDFIIEKYAQYVTSEYFTWASGNKVEVIERPKYGKRFKLSDKEESLTRISERREYYQRKEFEKILNNLPKEVLLKCADRLISEGKIKEPYSEYTPQDKFINELYIKSIPIFAFSKKYPDKVEVYAKAVDKLTDEFEISKHMLKSSWNLGSKIDIGDIVYIDRTNERIRKTINEIEKIQHNIDNFNSDISKIDEPLKIQMVINNLKHKIVQLELQLNSYNKYMRAVQLKGIVVGINNKAGTLDIKLENTNKIGSYPISYISLSNKLGNNIPIYMVAESNAFDPSADLKESNLLPISSWIKYLLKIKSIDLFSKERINELYEQALSVFKELSKEEKIKLNNVVINRLPEKYRKDFTNGIPNKGPLLFIYPPVLPEIPDNDAKHEAMFEQFNEYSKNLKDYTDNLTPETNPFVKIGVPVTNQLINKIKVFPSLEKAIKGIPASQTTPEIKGTPVNGFFKLSSINDFVTLVINNLTDKEKRQIQSSLLSEQQIKEFYENFYSNNSKGDKGDIYKSQLQYKPIINPKITLINELKSIIDPDKYIKSIGDIDKKIKITKVVGDEVFIEGRDKPITKINIERMITNSLEQEYQQTSQISTISKSDHLLQSIEFGLLFNPTFQLLDLSKRIRDTYIVHSSPIKYRIRIVDHGGKFYTGWTINPIKEIQGKQTIYKYNYSLIVTDFTEYLKLYRNNLIFRYETFRQLDMLNYDEFMSSNYILRHINYISQYLKDIGEEDNFSIEIIKQQDANLKIRQDVKIQLLDALKFMSGNIIDTVNLQKIANDIEQEIYDSFQDIRNGIFKKNVSKSNIINTSNSEHFELLKKFQKSALPGSLISNLFSSRGINEYALYRNKISITVFNIYRTNNFIKDYINGNVSIDSVINHDLSQEEINEKEDTIESLINWKPNTDILNDMMKAYSDAFERTITNGPELIDISIITLFENETRKKMSFLNKKLALIELVKIRSWQNTIKLINNIPDSKKLMFLIKHRNALRSINNITSSNRLSILNNLRILILKCGIIHDSELIEIYIENIENACYNLSNNEYEYNKICNNIMSSEHKACKLISEFYASGSGPVDIIVNIAELYLEFGKTELGKEALRKSKLGDWNGIKNLPNDLLESIKKVANTMTDAIERKKNGIEMIKANPELGIQEFKVIKDIDGNFIIKQIDKPIVFDEKKRNLSMLLRVIKSNYIPRINDVFSMEIQKIIDTTKLSEHVMDELNSRENMNTKDIEKLKSFTYEQLLNIDTNFYREPTFMDVIPLSFAKEGTVVYPVKTRGGFLTGGKLPLDAKAYRYRDGDGKIKTRLIEICEWIGITAKNREIIYPEWMKSIYANDTLSFETSMLNCVSKLRESSLWIKIYDDELVNSKEVLSKVIKEFEMYKPIEESVIKYFNEFGGNKKLFINGGTKEEYDSFLSNTLYTESLKRLLGISTLTKPKEEYVPNITIDDRIDVSILKNGNQIIYRKLHKSKTQKYPVPIRYNSENYPVYSRQQKLQLVYLIENGYLSPWYKNRINISKNKDDIIFQGDLPFVIDESSDIWNESDYYVEQTFKDPMYGLPIVTRIGIFPKGIEGVEGLNIIKKIKKETTKYAIKEEQYKIKYFRSEIGAQSQLTEFVMIEAQKPQSLSKKELAKKSGYSIIDPRTFVYSVKYDPDDVWSWDPLKDYKVGASSDNDKWIAEKNKQISILKEWLIKAGSSSSAFIAAKNEATRFLQMFRVNLPSQKRNEFSQTKFKKPVKSSIELDVRRIGKTWKKYTKDKLINEAKRIGFYTDDMKSMKAPEIISKMKSKLDSEIKLNASTIIAKIGIVEEIDTEYFTKMYNKIEESNYAYYISNFIKVGYLTIDEDVMKVIRNPKSLFRNYNRSGITFNENTGGLMFIQKYSDRDDDIYEKTTTETIYEILKNMSYTTNFGFNKEIIEYVNDINLIKKLEKTEQSKLISRFPILLIIFKIKQKGLNINIWNILTTAYDNWYPVFYHGMKKEISNEIKKRTLKYKFENPISITLVDAINYLGDSYYQNVKYKKGIQFEMSGSEYTGNVLYLHPGCRFEKIKLSDISFTDDTSSVARYVHNPYLTMFRNINEKDPKTSTEVLVVGNELHNNKKEVSSNLARRHALLYNLDISNVNPCFNLPDPNISGKFRDVAINSDDINKFLAKGGNNYTILEMPDTELKFRKFKVPLQEKMTVINLYRTSLKEFFKSKEKKKTYTDLIQRKRLNPLTFNIYMKKVEEANVPFNQLNNYIDALDILPDFMDAEWPYRKKYLEKDFVEKTKLSISAFLNGDKRDLYINVTRPTERLYV